MRELLQGLVQFPGIALNDSLGSFLGLLLDPVTGILQARELFLVTPSQRFGVG